MRPILYLISGYLLICLPLLGEHRRDTNKPAPAANAPQSGIQADDSFPVESLVQDVFVSGACNTITNIRAIGDKKGIGYFQNGEASIGMSRGVIISTGPVGNARGPNTATDKSGDFQDYSGDPDLDIMATGDVKDAVGIEFDFMPLDSFVTFSYVFASEEYCEFVGSIYNDVFGFFIRGPGIDGGFSNNAQNVALIPGTDDFVSINSVNYQQNENYYTRNELIEDAVLCGLSTSFDDYHSEIEYDGFTKKLTAVLRLQPCQTYHIRLVVADVGDNFYDSAVFLAAESFNLGGEVEISAGTGVSPASPSLEGCQGAYFTFERLPGSNLQFPLTVNYTISPLSTALPGLDFEPLSGYATIPSAQSFVQVPVNFFNDGLPEPTENIVLELDIPCACFTDTARMYIADSRPIAVRLNDFSVCENGSALISPVIQGGTAPFAYAWNTGETGASLNASANGPPQYAVTVYDACGNSAADSAAYFLSAPPEATLNGQVSLCEGDTAFLPVGLSGSPPWSIAYSLDGVPQPEITGIFDSNFGLPVTLPGDYRLQEVHDAACEGYVSGQALVEMHRISLEIESYEVSCPGAADGGISVEITGGTPPIDYFWRENIGNSLAPGGLPEGTFHLVVTDGFGCRKEVAVMVESPAPLEALQPDCGLLAQGQLALNASGGSPPYLYSLDGQAFYDDALLGSLQPGLAYNLTIQDANGCQFVQDFIMPASYGQMIVLPEEMEASLGRRFLLQPELNIPESLIGTIRWTPAAGLSCSDCLAPELLPFEEHTYTLRIVDIYGCSAEASIHIKIDDKAAIFVPTAFSPNGDFINDRFTVYANTFQVKEIASFRVFDRWGGVLFKRENFPPNDESEGWDGTAEGQLLNPGVYTFMAEVALLNGTRQIVGGHVVLMR
ncbi:MAG: choice-of-anchor L domain-containing protein [Lewinellaceae bacterium]|nr:choice-of-anchor L domain-containing protein [Phaeodactylibacter sp.]MCB9035819.1 choice-of-anchor L domain-containing protein [Lewinellaceae bacterium]